MRSVKTFLGARALSVLVVAPAILLASAGHASAQARPEVDTRASESIARREDGRFQFVLGAFVTAAGTDVALSMYKIGTGSAREVGFGAWWQDSPVAFAVSKSALSAVFAYELQQLHRTHPKAAFFLGIGATSFESLLVARTARLGPPTR